MTLSPEARISAELIASHAKLLAGCTQGGLNFEAIPEGYIVADMLLREIRTQLTMIAREVKAAREEATG